MADTDIWEDRIAGLLKGYTEPDIDTGRLKQTGENLARTLENDTSVEPASRGFQQTDEKSTQRQALILKVISLSVAACLCITAGVYFYSLLYIPKPIGVQLTKADGEVTLEREGDKTPGENNMDICSGDRIETDRNGKAKLKYSGENTVISISVDTELELNEEDGSKRIRLEKGIIECTVAPQPEGKNMIVITPHARAEVMGTRFILSVMKDRSRLEVKEGKVRYTRLKDIEWTMIWGGHVCTIGPGTGSAVESLSVGGEEGGLKKYEWPMIAADAGWTGYSPDPRVKPPFRRKWATQGLPTHGMLVAEGKVFCRGYCLDAETGEILWKAPRQGGNNSTPVYHRGRLYLGRGTVEAYDATTGRQLWVKHGYLGRFGPRGGLVVSNGAVYCGKVKEHGGKKFYFACALDAENGNEIWATPLVAVVEKKHRGYHFGVGMTPPVAANGMIFTTTDSPKMLFALDQKTGKVLWHQKGVGAWISLGTDGKTVWAPAFIQGVLAFDAAGGKKLWRWGGFKEDTDAVKANYAMTGTAKYPPVVAYGKLFFQNYGRRYTAIDEESGKQLWIAGDNKGHGWAGTCGPPTAAAGYIYTNGTTGKDYQGKGKYRFVLAAVDHHTGNPVWCHPTTGKACARVSIAYGRLYLPSLNEISCFEPVSADYKPPQPQATPTQPAGHLTSLAKPFTGKPGAPGNPDKPKGGNDWPMYGGCPARCGLELKIGLPIKEAWKFQTGSKVKSSPVIAGGLAFAGSDSGELFALELETGKKKWSAKITPPSEAKINVKWIRSAPAVAEGIVVCGADDGVLRAFDAKNGKCMWQFRTAGRIRSSPAIVGDRVVFGSWDGRCYCVRLGDGAEFWRWRAGDPGVRVYTPPALAAGRVYVGAWEDHKIHALDLGTGKPLPGYQAKSGYATKVGLVEGLAVYRGVVVTCKAGGAGQLINPDSGEVLSHGFGLGSSRLPALPALSGDRVYHARSLMGVCLSAVLSKEPSKKKSPVIWFKNPVLNAPLVCGDLIIVTTSKGTLEAYRQPDEKTEGPASLVWQWKSESGKEIHTAPAAAAGFIVIGSDDGNVYGFSYTKRKIKGEAG